MNRITVVIVPWFLCIVPAAVGGDPPGSLEAVRQQGRAGSRFLRDGVPAEQQPADAPNPTALSFKEAVEPTPCGARSPAS